MEQSASWSRARRVDLELRRGDAVRKIEATLAQLPEGLPPDELPPAGENLPWR